MKLIGVNGVAMNNDGEINLARGVFVCVCVKRRQWNSGNAVNDDESVVNAKKKFNWPRVCWSN